MTWRHHIENVVEKLSTACFVMRQIRDTVSAEVLRCAYFGLVQSILSYGLIFWGNSAHIDKVFVMQKKIIRCMMRVHPQTHCKPLFINLSIMTVPSLFIFNLALNIKKQNNQFQRNNNIHNYHTRTSNQLHLPFSRLSVSQNSPIYLGISCYNKFIEILSIDEMASTFTQFKNKLYKYLVSKAFYSVEEFLSL